jgi:hypothetical protein
VVSNTTTDTNGNYLFSDLIPAKYYLKITLPDGYELSPQNTTDDDIDSDGDPVTFSTDITELTGGDSDISWDFGIYQNSSIEIEYGMMKMQTESKIPTKMV